MNVAFAGFRHGHVFSALRHIRTIKDINITAASEIDAKSIEKAKENEIEITHSDYDDMLKSADIDTVIIGDYYAARDEKIIKALKANKNVYSDKPICTTLKAFYEIERLVKEKGLYIGCILDLRCHGAAAAAKEIVESGKLGEIHNISFGGQHALNYGARPNWYFEKGKHGGTINDIAVHGIDLIRYITKKGVKEVTAARCFNAYAKEVPSFLDSAQFLAVLDGGAGLIADVSYSMPSSISYDIPFNWRFTFWGENGIMEFRATDDDVSLSLNKAKNVEVIKGTAPTKNPFDDFLAEVKGKKTELSTAEILNATKDTLLIQEKSRESYN